MTSDLNVVPEWIGSTVSDADLLVAGDPDYLDYWAEQEEINALDGQKPITRNDLPCPYCGGMGGCEFVGGGLGDESLTTEDWCQIHAFLRTTYLPFVHEVIAAARVRRGLPAQADSHTRKKASHGNHS